MISLKLVKESHPATVEKICSPNITEEKSSDKKKAGKAFGKEHIHVEYEEKRIRWGDDK